MAAVASQTKDENYANLGIFMKPLQSFSKLDPTQGVQSNPLYRVHALYTDRHQIARALFHVL